jgi:hypothetical protein
MAGIHRSLQAGLAKQKRGSAKRVICGPQKFISALVRPIGSQQDVQFVLGGQLSLALTILEQLILGLLRKRMVGTQQLVELEAVPKIGFVRVAINGGQRFQIECFLIRSVQSV